MVVIELGLKDQFGWSFFKEIFALETLHCDAIYVLFMRNLTLFIYHLNLIIALTDGMKFLNW